MKRLLTGTLVLALASAAVAFPQAAPPGGNQPTQTQTDTQTKAKKAGKKKHGKKHSQTGSNRLNHKTTKSHNG